MNNEKIVRVCVCGGRDYTDKKAAFATLDKMMAHVAPWDDIVIVHGCAKGADALAEEYAITHNLKHEKYTADWKKSGNAAGHIRNRRMLESGLDLLVALPGGKGTANMVKICNDAGVRVWRPLG